MEALLATVGKREACAQALASPAGRKAFLRQASAACAAGMDRKQGLAALKLAQGCLQQLTPAPAAGGAAPKVLLDAEAQLALYQAASAVAHAVVPRAGEVQPAAASSSTGSLAGGLERILYHLIARGVELKQHRDVQELTKALAARVSALLEAGPPPAPAAAAAVSPVEDDDDGDDWGAEAATAAAAPTAASRRKGTAGAGSKGASKAPKGGEGAAGAAVAIPTGPGFFGFPAPPAGCSDGTLAKLVCGAAVNGVRALVESTTSPNSSKQLLSSLEAAVVECPPWLTALMGGGTADVAAARDAADRLFRALWKAAVALDHGKAWDEALRLRRVAVVRVAAGTRGAVGVSSLVGQLWRAGAAYEKLAAAQSSAAAAKLLEGVLDLYETAGADAVFHGDSTDGREHWAVGCVEALDWARHHGGLCARLQQPARAQAFVQQALASCERKDGKKEDSRLGLARVALQLQLATGHLAAAFAAGSRGSQGGNRRTSSIPASSSRSGKGGGSKLAASAKAASEEDEGCAALDAALAALDAAMSPGQQLLEHRPHLVRVWRALARLPTALPTSALTADGTTPATVEAAARGFLALAALSQALLQSPSPADGLTPTSLGTTLVEAHLRLGFVLTSLIGDAANGSSSSAAAPPAWASKPATWIAGALDGSGPVSDAAALAATCLERAEAAFDRCSAGNGSSGSNLASARRRLATSWYSLGRALLLLSSSPSLPTESGAALRALGPLARGCRLLLSEEDEGAAAELLPQTQADLRLATLAAALAGVGAGGLARSVAARALALAVAVPARVPGLVRRLLPCTLASSGTSITGAQVAAALKKAGAPAWASEAIEAVVTAGEGSTAADACPLCLLLPGSDKGAGRALVARAELSAHLSAVHSGLRSALSSSTPAAAETPLAEARAALLAHRRCCREAAGGCGLSPLAVAVEGARVARVLARAQAAARAQGREAVVAAWLEEARREAEGEKASSLEAWAARLAEVIVEARRRGSTGKEGPPAQALYELAVAECVHGILLAESAAAAPAPAPSTDAAAVAAPVPAAATPDATTAAGPLARGLEAWRALCAASDAEAVAIDLQLARQCFEALADHLGGDGPVAVRQAQVMEAAAEVSRRFLPISAGRAGGAFMASVLGLLFARLEVPDVAAAYAARAAALADEEENDDDDLDLSSPSGLVRAARALAAGRGPAALERVLLVEGGEEASAPLSMLRGLGHLVAADAALLEGDLPRALRTLRRLSALCQGLPLPPSLGGGSATGAEEAAERDGEEEEGGEAVRMEVVLEEDEDVTAMGRESSSSSGNNPGRPSICPPAQQRAQGSATSGNGDANSLLPPLLAPPLLRPTWCLAECLVRLAELWETLGVAGKAAAYFRKAHMLAQRAGNPGAARRAARGRARVKGEDAVEGSASASAGDGGGLDEALDEAEALLRRGDAARAAGEYAAAEKAYEGADERRAEAAKAHPLALVEHSPPSAAAAAARWRALGAALCWRREWTGGWLLSGGGGGGKKGNKKESKAPSAVAAELLAVARAREDAPVPAVERADALLRLAALKAQAQWDGEARALLEAAWAIAERSRCPRLLRAAGRALAALMADGREAACSAAALLGRTIGAGFGNGAPLLAASAAQQQTEETGDLAALLPEGWTVVTLALAPTAAATADPDEGGDASALLVGRIERGGAVLGRVCGGDGEGKKKGGLAHALRELEAVMEGNAATLKAPSAEELASWGKKEKAAWWREREALDQRLGALLEDAEAHLGPYRWLLGGQLPRAGEEAADAPVGVVDAAIKALGLCGGEQMAPGLVLVRATLAGLVGGKEDGRAALEEALVLGEQLGLGGCARPKPGVVDAALALLGEPVAGEPETEAAPSVVSTKAGGGKAKPSSKAAAPAVVDVEALCRDLSKLTVADLKKELAARALPTTGVKAALLSRLEASLKGGASSSSEEDETEGARRDAARAPSLDAVFAPSSSSSTSSRAARGSTASAASAASAASSRGRATSARSSVESSVSSASSAAAVPAPTAAGGPARHPVILILDETLQCLPWESLSLLRGHPVSRCPSLDYVRAALLARRGAGVSSTTSTTNGKGKTKGKGRGKGTAAPAEQAAAAVATVDGHLCVPSAPGYYLLDPEANLPNTRATLQPALARLADAHGNGSGSGKGAKGEWSGTVGEAPGEARLKAELGASAVFVYCGHGSGELFLPREEVAALARAPFAVLMGCSSGRLKAPTPAFEPGGMALSYLAAGAPAVVGNLWDVTDRDIDRFSLALLDRLFFPEEAEDGSVLEAVSAARAACKLPYLVGAAPVVYGLPLRVVRT